jgi:hypothetical protein
MVRLNKLWFFGGWSHLSQEKRKVILDFNCTDIVLGLNVNPKKFVFYNREKIIEDCKWLYENEIRIHIMPWVNCTDSFLIKMGNDVFDLIDDLNEMNIPVDSLLLDTEKHWYKNTYKVNDYIEEVEDALNQYIIPFKNKIKKDYNVELGTTSLLKIPEKVKPLAEISDYTIPQAYSVWFPTEKNHWSHDRVFEPIVAQNKAFKSWHPYSKKIIMGLACYYETRPGYPQKQNLKDCLRATLELGINEIAYWDIKQCVGSGRKKDIRKDFLSNLIIRVQSEEFDQNDWITLQKGLQEFHFNPGPLDGIPGPLTMNALDNFRINFELKRGGEVNKKDLITLLDNYCF